jgi:predicted permease
MDEVRIDAVVMAFAALLTVVTGLLFGLLPSLQHSGLNVTQSLKDTARGTTAASGRRLRQALITVEVALAVMLLSGGVLLIQTFVKLQQADLGFRTAGVLTGFVSPPPLLYDSTAKRVSFFDRLLERVGGIPGVEGAAFASVLPLAAGDNDTDFAIEGRPPSSSATDTPVTWYREVSAGYFETIGMVLLRGRDFTPGETTPSVIVNETLVRRYFPSEDPLGKRLRFGGPKGRSFTIIGVVADARVGGAREDTRVETFVPYWQLSQSGLNVVLRGSNPSAFAGPLRNAVATLDRSIAVVGVRTMDEIYRDAVGQPRFFAVLAGGFAVLALALAAIGLYGVMAYAVSQRTAEIGVRMAVGASISEVFRTVIVDGLKLTAVGIAIGSAGALLVGRWIGSLLYGVTPTDPTVLGLVLALLVATAVLASVIPAWRATRVDPISALRAE